MNMVDSEVNIDQIEIKDLVSTSYYFNVVQSNLSISNSEISNVTSDQDLIVVSAGKVQLSNINYTQSTTDLLRSTYSELSITFLSKSFTKL